MISTMIQLWVTRHHIPHSVSNKLGQINANHLNIFILDSKNLSIQKTYPYRNGWQNTLKRWLRLRCKVPKRYTFNNAFYGYILFFWLNWHWHMEYTYHTKIMVNVSSKNWLALVKAVLRLAMISNEEALLSLRHCTKLD